MAKMVEIAHSRDKGQETVVKQKLGGHLQIAGPGSGQ